MQKADEQQAERERRWDPLAPPDANRRQFLPFWEVLEAAVAVARAATGGWAG